jgi:uncharacterized damage-inducible protein DinB
MAKSAALFMLPDALLSAFAINDRINAYMLENLPAEAWRAKPPEGKGRDVAAIASHMHNVRVMWLKAVKRDGKIPDQLEKSKATVKQAIAALSESHNALATVLKQSLATDGRIKGFKPDAAAFFGYLIAHDAHHRGQIAQLGRQVGYPLPQKAMFGMWEWGTR